MSDQWFYRIKGNQFGPVALNLVRSLVSSGTIAPDDEVRDATSPNWLLACAATELRDSRKPQTADLAVERRMARDEWFCRGVAGDYGPLQLVDLIRMAAEGELTPDEEIKATADDYWKQVRSYSRLTQLLPFDHANQSVEHQATAFSDLGTLLKTTSLFEEQFDDHDRPSIKTKSEPLAKSVTNPNVDSHRSPDSAEDDQPDVLLFPGVCSSSTDLNSTLSPTDTPLEGIQVDRPTEPVRPSLTKVATTADNSNSCTMDSVAPDQSLTENDSLRIWDPQESEIPSGNLQWTGWIDGDEFGPVDYAELLSWAVTGKLSPTDFVRRGTEGPFVPAVNIPCLFTVRAAANSLSRPATLASNTKSAASVHLEQVIAATSDSGQNVMTARQPTTKSTPCQRELDQAETETSFSIIPMISAEMPCESPAHSPTSKLSHLATDATSVGVSAMLTIGLVILGWVASL